MPYFKWLTNIGGQRFGLAHDLVFEDNQPYLERWILWFGFTLRLHKFHKGDDDRACHDHPWWFITIPLRSYLETTPGNNTRLVARWRPHFRPAKHRHIVSLIEQKPVWTFIITGPKCQEWGFWEQEKFTHHSQWLDETV